MMLMLIVYRSEPTPTPFSCHMLLAQRTKFNIVSRSYWLNLLVKSVNFVKVHENVPSKFMKWLCDSTGRVKRDATARVAFGPNKSFFAWDSQSYRWSKIPTDLDEMIQAYLSPTGWRYGAPKLVTLGYKDTWAIIFSSGIIAHSANIPPKLYEWISQSNVRFAAEDTSEIIQVSKTEKPIIYSLLVNSLESSLA
jgi:hypothetical protein